MACNTIIIINIMINIHGFVNSGQLGCWNNNKVLDDTMRYEEPIS